MSKDQNITVAHAIHKLQLAFLDGVQDEGQLFAAGTLMCRSDYEDIVVERSIANACGYPLCPNALPSERPHKGHYRISLKEHRVYDLHETYMYCSSGCLINSRAFAGSLQDDRCLVMNPAKLNEVLSLFDNLGLESEEEMGQSGDLGLSKLKIQEKAETNGEVAMEEWVGPSNAIEGYVPHRYHNLKPSSSKTSKKVSELGDAKVRDALYNEGEFKVEVSNGHKKAPRKVLENEKYSGSDHSKTSKNFFGDMDFTSCIITNDEYTISKKSDGDSKSYNVSGGCSGVHVQDDAGIDVQSSKFSGKSSLKSKGTRKALRSVNWADEKKNGIDSRSLCEVKEFKTESTNTLQNIEGSGNDESQRFASAQACAIALSQASEAVASGHSDIIDAVSDVGIIVLPRPDVIDEEGPVEGEGSDEDDGLEDRAPVKWPKKLDNLNSDVIESGDSWFGTPPDGFGLTLSPFATMWDALFSWTTSSSLAYVYGRDESCHEEYLFVNGREYPSKVVLPDGRSSEIKQTLAGCLARALPGVIAALKLPTPVSTVEQGMACFLETMSFMDALPPFRVKQWQVIVLLLIDALSICRIPGLSPHLTSRRLIPKVLEGARISAGEYEILKDIVIPLGRVPQFSMQSGG